MTYNSNLKNWGATGSEYPDNYAYEENVSPVDEWDNFFAYNVVEDIQHLIDKTEEELATETWVNNKVDPEFNDINTQISNLENDVNDLESNLIEDHIHPVRSTDPSDPQEGQVWIRDDL